MCYLFICAHISHQDNSFISMGQIYNMCFTVIDPKGARKPYLKITRLCFLVQLNTGDNTTYSTRVIKIIWVQ